MCGRYSLTNLEAFFERLHIIVALSDWVARYNITPDQEVPVVLDGRQRTLETCRWGLVPSWTKDLSTSRRSINARAETVAEKPSFRKPFASQRCWVLADGYYEWRKTAGGKVPYRICRQDAQPFVFAGLWDQWSDPAGKGSIRSCAIVTTQAHPVFEWIHPRMPVMLDAQDAERWLDTRTKPADLHALLKPWDDQVLHAYPVSSRVNSPANDDASLLEAVSPERDLFGNERG